MSIPARPLNSSEQSSMTGPTTGQVNCTFGFFQCRQGVSQNDIDSLVSQIQPQLEQQITRELENKTISVSGKAVSPVKFPSAIDYVEAAVGEKGKTVTVNVTGTRKYRLHSYQRCSTYGATIGDATSPAVWAKLSAPSLIDYYRAASYRGSRFWFNRY